MKNAYSSLLSFLKLFFCVVFYLGGLAGAMWLFGTYFGENYALVAMWFYLIISSFSYIYIKNKNSFSRDNLKKLFLNFKFISKIFLIFIGYVILVILGIIFLFIIGGWIAGLSATTIIIILLLFILFK